jgi:hypothetical protein
MGTDGSDEDVEGSGLTRRLGPEFCLLVEVELDVGIVERVDSEDFCNAGFGFTGGFFGAAAIGRVRVLIGRVEWVGPAGLGMMNSFGSAGYRLFCAAWVGGRVGGGLIGRVSDVLFMGRDSGLIIGSRSFCRAPYDAEGIVGSDT